MWPRQVEVRYPPFVPNDRLISISFEVPESGRVGFSGALERYVNACEPYSHMTSKSVLDAETGEPTKLIIDVFGHKEQVCNLMNTHLRELLQYGTKI